MLERFFKLSENQTTARIEMLAGITTFLTMAYIIVVQPGTDGVARALSHRASARHGHKFLLHILHDAGSEGGAPTSCPQITEAHGSAVTIIHPVTHFDAIRMRNSPLKCQRI
jgi:hypothetical protein